MIKGRRARASGVTAIHELIAYYADQGLLLPRTKVEVRINLGRFLIARRRKIARDCRHCPRASNYDLSAVAITLRPQHAVLPVQPTAQPLSA